MKEYTHYQEFGKGQTLLLLPSNWLTTKSYKTFAEKLSNNFRVIIPELFRGKSRYKKNAFSIDDYTEKLHFLVNDLKIKKFYLLGISFSGLIAIDYLHKYPLDLKKVMLVSIIAPPLFPKERKLTLLTGFVNYAKLFLHNFTSWKGTRINFLWLSDGLFNCLIKHPKQFFLDAIIATKTFNKTPLKVSVPTKILLATKDEFVPYDNVNKTIAIDGLEIEAINGYHAWFFLNENLLVKKVIEYFTSEYNDLNQRK